MENRPWQARWKAESVPVRVGGQARIHKVRRNSDGRLGALKELHVEHLKDSERRARMAREVDALIRLNGAGVPLILDHNMEQVGEAASVLYFVEDWIDGVSLQEYAGGNPRGLDEAICLTKSLAGTVKTCHEAGVIHRDVKPDNVILRVADKVSVLVDFGMAYRKPEASESEGDIITEGQEIGSRFLRLPEHGIGGSQRDQRSDVTQIVGILFFLLTGRHPRRLLDERLKPPHEVLFDFFKGEITNDRRWPAIRRFFDVGFQYSIERRFQNCQRMLEYLDTVNEASQDSSSEERIKDEVRQLDQLLEKKEFEDLAKLDRSLADASNRMLNRLTDLVRENQLFLRRAGIDRMTHGRMVTFVFGFSKSREHAARVDLEHQILVSSGEAIAAYSFIPAIAPWEYYRGPVVDTESLQEAVLRKADIIFAEAVGVLRRKIEKGDVW